MNTEVLFMVVALLAGVLLALISPLVRAIIVESIRHPLETTWIEAGARASY